MPGGCNVSTLFYKEFHLKTACVEGTMTQRSARSVEKQFDEKMQLVE